jgi:hypothetical protein
MAPLPLLRACTFLYFICIVAASSSSAALAAVVPASHEDRIAILGSTPDIFLIGATRSATATFADVLHRHLDICPQLHPPSPKSRANYFDVPVSEFRTDVDAMKAYKRSFHPQMESTAAAVSAMEQVDAKMWDGLFGVNMPSKRGGAKSRNAKSRCRYTVDYNPRYFTSENALVNMNATFTYSQFASKKFILLLREPTSRECSTYQHLSRICLDHLRQRDHLKTAIRNSDYPSSKEFCAGSEDTACEQLSCSEKRDTADPFTSRNYVGAIATFKEYISRKYAATIRTQNGRQVNLSVPRTDNTNPSLTSATFYDSQLRLWRQYVRHDQMLVINMDDLIANPKLIFAHTAKFLNLSASFPGTWFAAERSRESVGNVTRGRLPAKNMNRMKTTVPICDSRTLRKLNDIFYNTSGANVLSPQVSTVYSTPTKSIVNATVALVNMKGRHANQPRFNAFIPFNVTTVDDADPDVQPNILSQQTFMNSTVQSGIGSPHIIADNSKIGIAKIATRTPTDADFSSFQSLTERTLGSVPEILIIGAAKSATTSLHQLLATHRYWRTCVDFSCAWCHRVLTLVQCFYRVVVKFVKVLTRKSISLTLLLKISPPSIF